MLATPELLREAALPWRLGAVLPQWLSEVPLYQPNPQPVFAGGALSLNQLQRLPLITKQDIRGNFPHNFLRAGEELEALLAEERIELEHTSGTSEVRTPLLLGRGWWAEQEERALRLNPLVAGVLNEFPQARRVNLSSPVCSGDICYTGVPSREERTLGNTLFLSLSRFPFLWSEAELGRMAEEALDWEPQFLDVDPVYGLAFARYCERRGLRLPSLRFILASYEFVSVTHQRVLERAFGVPVFNLYGSTETGHLLMETGKVFSALPCRSRREEAQTQEVALSDQSLLTSAATGCEREMRPSYETAFLEVLEPDGHGIGELVVTTLTNDYMPLIRYRIGDLVERHERPYRTTFIVHGRAADAFHTPDGERVTTWQIDQCFTDIAGIIHYQLAESATGEWRLRYVPELTPPAAAALAELQERLTRLLGLGSGPGLEPTDLLMPESSGKFRLGYPARKTAE
jgi:phenylacetate-CoA ligase